MKRTFIFIFLCCTLSCTKKLNLKPDSSIVLPQTISDLEQILDNDQMDITQALPQISADEYFIPSKQDLESTYLLTTRNASIWATDIYQGESQIADWNLPYKNIFYCNSVLDILQQQDISGDAERKRVKGWALFNRSYAFYNLLSTFSKAYDSNTASTDLGIPLRLSAAVDELAGRSSVQQCYEQVQKDLIEAAGLLQQNIIPEKRNRPSKVAAYAMLARIYLSMREYEQAEQYADKTLEIYAILTDFNTLNKTSSNGFSHNSEEIIYHSRLDGTYFEFSMSEQSASYGVNPEIIALYDPSDLRLPLYFQKNSLGNYNMKPINNTNTAPFTGLATDEIYLIKAECLARRGQTQDAMALLNQLLSTRWDSNATGTTKPYTNLSALNPDEALQKILLERRKSLIWRSLRWTDLKRLNLEGANIQLLRKIGDQTYTLMPNSPKYVLPIPEDERALSGLTQNPR
ncbi:hypothetical protein CPT03_13385 [Pedobacter ginsengisoli]|uniref:Uncharacterized protein n=1 Tax=Pedobacter ginsengisoli TaxID=363852 RepID=A0A2D1U729_9SPHI|nr:RagB/SusD family nutrient uptake outer membrane protein [Pedobacter ginsengisoli]ATP57390.1 hypothetical protein CPT03_13385 [Pedobacter ginsengisoli]